MKKTTLMIAGLALLAAPVAVFAATDKDEPHHPRMEQMFDKKDVNKDGKLSKDEVGERWAKKFVKLDLNKDGFITKEEAKEAHEKMRKEHLTNMMMRLDTDSNGEVSESEYTAFAIERFKKADKDGNGSLSMEEMAEARKFMRPGHGPDHKGDKKG